MSALLLGSISTVADTSELQRQAFNQAFAAHGLDWRWDRDDYRAMLATSGGQDRIAEYARARGEDVDAAAVHETKSEIFQRPPGHGRARAPPGRGRHDRGGQGRTAGRSAWSPRRRRANVAALLGRAAARRSATRTSTSSSTRPASTRPSRTRRRTCSRCRPWARRPATASRSRTTSDGVAAAVAAGVPCVAFPNENTGRARLPVRRRGSAELDFAELQSLTAGLQRALGDHVTPGRRLTATDTAFHVEAYEKIDYSLLLRRRRLRASATPSSPTATARSGAA